MYTSTVHSFSRSIKGISIVTRVIKVPNGIEIIITTFSFGSDAGSPFPITTVSLDETFDFVSPFATAKHFGRSSVPFHSFACATFASFSSLVATTASTTTTGYHGVE